MPLRQHEIASTQLEWTSACLSLSLDSAQEELQGPAKAGCLRSTNVLVTEQQES